MADVSVHATTAPITATARTMRSVVFTTDLKGYCCYIAAGDVQITRTTDGGATWTVGSAFMPAGPAIAIDVWYDQWTPGDTGTKLWIAYFDATSDTVRVRTYDTATNTFGTNILVFTGASAVAGRGAFVSITKSRSGYIYVAYDLDAGAERGFHRSTDGGATYSANLSTTFVEATLDTCKLYPASGTGDDNDCWAVYYDASATALTLKLWDSSAASATESATIQTHTDGATDLTGQFGYDAAVRHSDGHLILAAVSLRDNASSVHQVFDVTSTSSFATKTNITTNIDDHYYPQVFIDQATNNLYVTYNGKRDGSEVLDTTTKVYYTKSTDGGTTWSAGDTAYMEGAAGVVQQVWTPNSGLRFYAVWRVGTTLVGNAVNSVSTPSGPAAQGVTGVTITTGSGANAPTVALGPGADQGVTGTTLGVGSSVTAPTVAPVVSAQTIYSTARIFYTETLLLSVGTAGGGSTQTLGFVSPDSRQYCQTISGHDGLLTSVSLSLRKSGSPTDAMYVVIRESTVTGTVVGTSLLVSGTGISTTYTLVNFPIPSGVLLNAGTTYWVEPYLTRTVQDIPNTWEQEWTTDSYAGGTSTNPNGSIITNSDFIVRLYTGTSHTVAIEVGGADQAVTGTTLAAGSAVTAPTVAPGAVTLTGATLTSGVQVRVPTVVPDAVTVNAATVSSSLQVREPTVAVGAVTVTGATMTSSLQVQVPMVTAGAVTVTGATVTTGSVVREPSVSPGALTLTGATLTTGLQAFAPTVTVTAVTISAATVTSGSVLAVPMVTPGAVAVTGATFISPGQSFTPTVTAGAVEVSGSTRPTTTQVFEPTVSQGVVTISGATVTSGAQLAVPTIVPGAVTVTGAMLMSGTLVREPTVTTAAVTITITGATLASGLQIFVPTLATGAVPPQVVEVEHITMRQPQATLLGASAAVEHVTMRQPQTTLLVTSPALVRLILRTPHVRQDQEA